MKKVWRPGASDRLPPTASISGIPGVQDYTLHCYNDDGFMMMIMILGCSCEIVSLC